MLSSLTANPADAALYDALSQGAPINVEEAARVMDRHDLDAILIGEPVSVFHALGHWPQIARTRLGQPPGTFAILRRSAPDRPVLITSRFLHYYTWADGRVRPDVDCWLYDDLADDDGPVEGSALPGDIPLCPDRGAVALSPLEAHRLSTSRAALNHRHAYRNAGGAITAALRELGLWQGRLACDHPVFAEVLARHNHAGFAIIDYNIMREIRLIKSPLEIALMSRAAEANVQALEAVGHAARAGATYRDMHALFRAEAAARGNTAVFLNIDRASSELVPFALRDGQALFLDAVSHFQHYHGDFARTVFIGDPPAAARRAADAAAFAWNAVREALKPGLKYSDIVRIGQEALKKGGHDAIIGFGPHSCGLAHTDEPGEDAGGFWRKPDITLRPGMILSVDCPVLDSGIGGSAHCEDLVLITPDGCEPIHSLHEPVIVV
ncbi:M24 family metallopeptidase [Novosphingobium sp. FSY-8]|uniref:M24 family metallopeptidase n=1 Tax=Novosphingobium ovatum TaxID=1908523 RepID=A0ABW9XBU1_9SPHN|nr:M24 family metallopeptidase [Novosphingobium ovatum]